jgi:hypothetical protein
MSHESINAAAHYGLDVLKSVNQALGSDDLQVIKNKLVASTRYVQTPTGIITMLKSVADALLKAGVITGDLNGTLKADSAATVKAAMMAHTSCDFCTVPGATHTFETPDFKLPGGAGLSVDVWCACDACAGMIAAGQHEALLKRARECYSLSKFSDAALVEMHKRFWNAARVAHVAQAVAMSVAEFVEDRMPDGLGPMLTARDVRVEAISRVAGLTPAEVNAFARDPKSVSTSTATKLLAWRQRFGMIDPKLLVDLFSKPQKPLDVVPHWQRALDMQFTAMAMLSKAMSVEQNAVEFLKEETDLNDPAAINRAIKMAGLKRDLRSLGYAEDVKLLRSAQAYSFNGETTSAIREAAASIPHDTPLSSIETPSTGAGWFWFSDPLPVAASPAASNSVNALLWGWTDQPDHSEPAILFSAYVIEDGSRDLVMPGKPLPSTRWYWPLKMSFHDMIAFNGVSWNQSYGPGGQYEAVPDIIGRDETLRCISELSLFFVMACLWFKQTVPILTREPGHVERHARKRYVREHKLNEPPSVHVVALRKSQRTPAEHAEGDRVTTAREYSCRWIVQGHPRLQRCGPGRKDQKLIWIDAYPKGPEDKPLRTRKTVFAVVR